MSKKEKVLDEKMDKLAHAAKKVEAFKDLLDSLDEIDSKKKILWKEIYDWFHLLLQ